MKHGLTNSLGLISAVSPPKVTWTARRIRIRGLQMPQIGFRSAESRLTKGIHKLKSDLLILTETDVPIM